MRSSRTLFDMADLNPLGNPLTSMDEDFDEITGLPRSIADSLMGVPSLRKKKRYPWDENPNPMEEEMSMPPGVPAPAPGAGSIIPLGPPEPEPQQRQAQPQQQQKGGWRNALRGIAGAVGDGLVGASTPNIAYGGGQDIIRAGAGGWGAHQSRVEKQRQREAEAERRKIALEDRRMKIEYDAAKAKRDEADAVARAKVAESTIKLHERQAEAADKKAEADERKSQWDHIHIGANGVYNRKTEQFTPFPDKVVAGDMLKMFNDMKAIYDKTGNPKDDPSSEENQKLLRAKFLEPKKDTNLTPFEASQSADPDVRAAAAKWQQERFNEQKILASIRKASDDGVLSPNEAAKLEANRQRISQAKESARSRAWQNYITQGMAADRLDTSKKRQEAHDRIAKDFTAETNRIEAMFADEEKANAESVSKIGSPAKGGGTAPPAGRTFTGSDGKKYRFTGYDAQGNIKGDLLPGQR